uniref:Uncharacterized protein n=1 Tax=Tanacetum cinerariifolium TaxID=118510 RepID=A0A6L2K5R8_TANCI|nr:hypothetical protein [Tanacetum cinerariifolium]
MSSSTVTYTSVYTDFKPWRIQWVSNKEPEAPEEAPLSPDSVPGPEGGSQGGSANYPAVGGDDDDDDESSKDDADDKEEEEASEEEDDDEEEDHLALTNSFVVPDVDHVSSSKDTEAFETDESAPTPPSPRHRKARISIKLLPPMTTSMEARIVDYVVTPNPPLLPPSPLTPLSSLLPQIPSPPLPIPSPPTTSPTYAEALLGNRAAEIRARFIAPAFGFKVEENSATTTARQPGLKVATVDATPECPMSGEFGYRIKDVWDDMVGDIEERAPTTDAHDDRDLQRDRVNTLFRDRRYHLHTTVLVESEATQGRQACHSPWTVTGRISDEDRLPRHIQHNHDRFVELVRTARDPEPHDGPVDAGSSSC